MLSPHGSLGVVESATDLPDLELLAFDRLAVLLVLDGTDTALGREAVALGEERRGFLGGVSDAEMGMYWVGSFVTVPSGSRRACR